MIKLLKTLFDISADLERRSDICLRLVLRMLDEDETVKVCLVNELRFQFTHEIQDLAVRCLEELWFSDSKEDAARWRMNQNGPITAYDVKAAFSMKISVIMSTTYKLRDRQLMEDLLHDIVKPKPGKDIAIIQERYSTINDAFIDSLVDGSELPEHVSS